MLTYRPLLINGKQYIAGVFKDNFVSVCRAYHLRLQTERAYWFHARKFILWTKAKSANELSENATDKFRRYLSAMANENPERIEGNEGFSASYQTQAFHALRFLYERVLDVRLGDLKDIPRATRFGRIVEVPLPEVATSLVTSIPGQVGLAIRLIYGTAGRLNDVLRLRVKDLDFDRKLVAFQESKGGKSRLVPMPESLVAELRALIKERVALHADDLANGFGWVALPGQLAKKYPKEQKGIGWQYVFAGAKISRDPITGHQGRYHLFDLTLQKAFARARIKCRVKRHYTIHSLRHAAAQFWERQGLTVSEIAGLLGHTNIETTHRYLKSGQRGVKRAPSPI